MRRWSYVALCAVLVVLSGCGGGSGGTVQPSGAFTLSASAASFSARQNGAAPGSQTLTIQITGPDAAYVGAAYTGGQTQPSWLGVHISGSGTTYDLVLSILGTALAPGQYTSTFQVGTANSSNAILQYRTVMVTYTVTAAVAITSQPYSGTFTYGGDTTSADVPVSVSAPGLQWTSSSDSPWLMVPVGQQSGTGTLEVIVNVASLNPGTYQGHVAIMDAADPTDSATLAFSVSVQEPTLAVAQSSVLLGGTDGLSTGTPQDITFSLSTGVAAHPFAISLQTQSGGNWLSSNVASGTVDAAGTEIQLSGNRAGLVGGTYRGTVHIAATVDSLSVTDDVPVTFNVEADRIVVGAAGVGFSASPAGSVLTRDVKVYSTLGLTNTPWQASSSQPWLTVTPSGVTGGAITLTASPSGLSTDTTHFATVTVTSSDPSVENQQTIQVGLYASSTAPSALSDPVAEQFVASSPVEPIAFVSNGGTGITGYNVYTGAIDRTFTGVVAFAGPMVVSGDGRYLFVYDEINQQVTQLDAASGSVLRQFPSPGQQGVALAYARPNGYPILITPSMQAYDLTTGAEYPNPGVLGNPTDVSLEASPDNSKLVDSSDYVIGLVRSALNGGELQAKGLLGVGIGGGAPGQACFSADGQMAYTANGYPYNFYGTALTSGAVTQVLPGQAYPDAITCVWNGLIVGGTDAYYSATDVFVYNGPTGEQVALMDSSSANDYRALVPRGLAVSADGTRMVTIVSTSPPYTEGSELRFQSLPAPP